MSNANMPANPVKGCDGRFIDDNELNDCWMDNCKPSIGLTKREHFAAMAMQGLLSDSGVVGGTDGIDACAQAAVWIADALLKELAK